MMGKLKDDDKYCLKLWRRFGRVRRKWKIDSQYIYPVLRLHEDQLYALESGKTALSQMRFYYRCLPIYAQLLCDIERYRVELQDKTNENLKQRKKKAIKN